jgi:site-specific DNA recombinase
MAHHYRAQLDNLYRALEHDDETKRFEAAEVIRSLIDAIILVPEGGELKIEVCGDLAGILAITVERKKPASSAGSPKAATLYGVSQFQLVAGARNHLNLHIYEYGSASEHGAATVARFLDCLDVAPSLYQTAA